MNKFKVGDLVEVLPQNGRNAAGYRNKINYFIISLIRYDAYFPEGGLPGYYEEHLKLITDPIEIKKLKKENIKNKIKKLRI